MAKEEFTLEEILSEFSDPTSPHKKPSTPTYDALFKETEDDIVVPDFVSNHKKITSDQSENTKNTAKNESDKDDTSYSDVKIKHPKKKADVKEDTFSEDIKIYNSPKTAKKPDTPAKHDKKSEESPKKTVQEDTKTRPEHTAPHLDRIEKNGEAFKHLMSDDKQYDDDYDIEEKPKRVLPYDIISGFEDDFTLGAKHCSKKIVKYSVLSGLSVPVMLVACIISFIYNFDLSAVPYIPEFLEITRPFEPIILLICQLLSMLLAIEIIVSGIYKLIMLSPTLDSAIAINSIVICAHNIQSVLTQNHEYIPYTAISCFVLMMALRQKRMKLIVHKRTYIASALSTAPTAVRLTRLKNSYSASKSPLKSDVSCRDIAQPSFGEALSTIFVPFMIVLPLVLAVLSCRTKGNYSTFLLDYAALASVSLPFGFIASSFKTEYKLSKKLFASGSAFIDYSQLKKLYHVKSAVVTDADVFPAGSAEITGMKVIGNHSIDNVISYATAVFEGVGGGAYKAFYDIAKSRYIQLHHAKNFHFYESGGISANIGSDNVLLGNASFLMRMGVNITHGINVKNNIFLSVNSSVHAVFTVRFHDAPNTYNAFRILKRHKIRPILASLDFQINPMLTEQTFDLSHDFIIYPDIDERIMLSGASYAEDEEPVALLSRDNMHSFSEILAYGKILYKTVRFNILFSFFSLTFGLGLVYFLVSKGEFLVISPYNAFLYLLLWYIPVLLKNISNNEF